MTQDLYNPITSLSLLQLDDDDDDGWFWFKVRVDMYVAKDKVKKKKRGKRRVNSMGDLRRVAGEKGQKKKQADNHRSKIPNPNAPFSFLHIKV